MSDEARDLFSLTTNYTLEDLKLKFRDLVLRYHPSKTKDTKMFEYIKKCYALLSSELKNPDKNPNFNLDNFNKDFVMNKVATVYDNTGYGDWIETTANQVEGKGAIVHKHEPEPLFTTISGLGGSTFYELGVDKIDNFSGKSGSHLDFMDYKLAHTTSALVNEKYVHMPTYKSIDELSAERSKLTYDVCPKDLQKIQRKKDRESAYEEKRLQKQREDDDRQGKIFERLMSVR
jgi:hypothetical protein